MDDLGGTDMIWLWLTQRSLVLDSHIILTTLLDCLQVAIMLFSSLSPHTSLHQRICIALSFEVSNQVDSLSTFQI